MIKINILIPVHKGGTYNWDEIFREMGERGRKRIENYFTRDAICRKLERFYGEVVRRNNRMEFGR